MSQTLSSKQKAAKRVFLQTGNKSEAARAAGVNRSTVGRWIQEVPEFLTDDGSVEPTDFEVATLVPKAIRILDNALEGERVTNSQIRAALEVVKASNALKAPSTEEKAASLLDLITAVDAGEDDLQDD